MLITLTVITQCLRPNTSYFQPGPVLQFHISSGTVQTSVFFPILQSDSHLYTLK